MGTGCVDKAAIFDAKGTSVWAASPHFKVRQHLFLYYFRGLRHAVPTFDGFLGGGGRRVGGDLRLTLGQQVEPSEIQSVVASFEEKQPKKIFGSGFKIAGEKYLTIHAEDRSVYGKKVFLR